MKIFYKGKKTKSKYKNSEVKSYIAKPMQIIAIYTFDSAVPCTPVFSFDSAVPYTSVFSNVNSYIETDVNNGDGTTTRTIRSFDLPTKIDFRNLGSLISVEYLNTRNITDMSFMFYNCTNLTSIDTSKWNTRNVTTMQNMFDLCSSLASLDLSNWNVSKVQNMSAMFGSCSSLKKLNVSNWKTNSLTKADWMFNKCLNLQYLDLSSWNVNNVNDMSYALSDCESLKQLDLSNWNLNNADITGVFSASSYSGCFNLNTISMNNSDSDSVNRIISELPTRTSDSTGVLNIAGIGDMSQVDTITVQTKYWNIIN